MLRSLSRERCALVSNLPARGPTEPPTYRAERHGVTRRTHARGRRR